jgi:hypothetical protein
MEKKMATKKSKKLAEVYPKVEIGNHLTVITYENGKQELIWDDERLLDEVREALASVENKK